MADYLVSACNVSLEAASPVISRVSADSAAKAAFLAGVGYGANLTVHALETGILDAVLVLFGREGTVRDLLRTAENEDVTVVEA